jgi:hypothetical protein
MMYWDVDGTDKVGSSGICRVVLAKSLGSLKGRVWLGLVMTYEKRYMG